MSASKLFDRLREELHLSSDAALARRMGFGESDISKARRVGRISDRMILRVHEYTGWPVVEIRQVLGQPVPHQ